MLNPDLQKKSTLNPRGLSSFGGYALSQRPCPINTSNCGGSDCCPTDYSCETRPGNPTVCCPSSDSDCRSTVGLLPACADNSWELYDPGTFGPEFCCLAGSIGAGTYSTGYRCMNGSLPIPASLEVPKKAQQTGSRTTQGSPAASTTGTRNTVSSSSSSNSDPTNASSNSGVPTQPRSFPTGAIAAIAVLATLVVILLVALAIVWSLYKKRRAARTTQGPVTSSQPEIEVKPSVTTGVLPIPDPSSNELSGETVNPHAELDGSRRT